MFISRQTSDTQQQRRWPVQLRDISDRWEKWWLEEIDYPLNTRYSDQESNLACRRNGSRCLASLTSHRGADSANEWPS